MPKKQSSLSAHNRRNILKKILRHATDEGFSSKEIFDLFTAQTNEIVDQRTIVRDLEYLSTHDGAYVIDEKVTPKKYIISKDYVDNISISISEENLQIINLALGLLNFLGPKSLTNLISSTENAIVNSLPKNLQKEFLQFKSLQSVGPSNAGKAVHDNENDLKNVLFALRKGRMIEGIYDSKHSGTKLNRKFGPIMIVLFGGAPYLLVEDYSDKESPFKRIKLSRFTNTKVLDERYTAPENGQEIDYKLFNNSFAGVGGDKDTIEHIKIYGNEKLFEHFESFILHPSQKLTILHNSVDNKINNESDNTNNKTQNFKCLLEFNMPISYPFVRYLAGLGGMINKIEPIIIRRYVRSIWKNGAEAFGLIVKWPDPDNTTTTQDNAYSNEKINYKKAC